MPWSFDGKYVMATKWYPGIGWVRFRVQPFIIAIYGWTTTGFKFRVKG